MPNDELMDKIYWHWRYVQGQDGLQALMDYRRVILEVVRLHQPDLVSYSDGSGCLCNNAYPCPTIKAIEKELN